MRLVNMDTNTARLAIVTGDIDAAFGGIDFLALRDQGAARIIFTTRGGDAKLTSNGLFLGSESFIRKYPEHTRRVVKTLVLAAKWLAGREGEAQPVYQLWTRSGSTFGSNKEDWAGEPCRRRPLSAARTATLSPARNSVPATRHFPGSQRSEWSSIQARTHWLNQGTPVARKLLTKVR